MKSTTDDTLAQWQLTNPTQVGDADASQRHAIAQAVGGKSFVLRGPPGCGKTQTLANMVAALVAEGKTVCVVAKLMCPSCASFQRSAKSISVWVAQPL